MHAINAERKLLHADFATKTTSVANKAPEGNEIG